MPVVRLWVNASATSATSTITCAGVTTWTSNNTTSNTTSTTATSNDMLFYWTWTDFPIDQGFSVHREISALQQRPQRRVAAPRYDADVLARRIQAVADQRAERYAHTERLVEAAEAAARLELERQQAERRRHDQQLERRKAANDTARELLLSHLTPAQRETFEGNGWFIVEGGRSRKQYRIHARGQVAGNIEGLDAGGRAIERFCSHLGYDIPPHDHHLAQKLFLEADEDEFLRRANRSRIAA